MVEIERKKNRHPFHCKNAFWKRFTIFRKTYRYEVIHNDEVFEELLEKGMRAIENEEKD